MLKQVGVLEDELEGEPDAERVAARLHEPSAYDRSEGFWAGRRLLEALAASLPVVLVLEDAQWATPTLLDFVDYLAGWTSAPVLMLVLGRPELLELRPEWRDDVLSLGPLSEAEALQLASSLAAGVPAEAVARAEGNPLFLEQLIASEADKPPPTLEALIESRLDQLPANERAVLERASVVGREFWRSIVEDASPEDERAAVGSALMALARRRLVHPDRSAFWGEDGFRFHHGLIRDVAYVGMATTDRSGLHERVARILESAYPDLDELIGDHLEQAALLSPTPRRELELEAARRLGEAGMRAFRRVDTTTARPLLSRAVALLHDEGERLELDWALGTSLKFAGDWPAAQARLDEVATRAAAAGMQWISYRAQIEQLLPRIAAGNISPVEGLAVLDEAIPILEAAGDELGLGRAWHLVAGINGSWQLQYEVAGTAGRRARAHYERSGWDQTSVVPLLAGAYCLGPTPAREAIEECRRLIDEVETPVWQSFVLPFLALVEAMDERFDDARLHLDEALAGRREFADPGTIATSWSALAAMIEILAGDFARAEEILASSCEALRQSTDRAWLAMNLGYLSGALYRQSRFEDALATSGEAWAAAPIGHLTARAIAGPVHAMSLARAGRSSEAKARADETLTLLAGCDSLHMRAAALAAAAEVDELAAVTSDRVGERWAEALTLFNQKGDLVSSRSVAERLAAVK
jgi:tetratricopeptide (TPR) repeat protein